MRLPALLSLSFSQSAIFDQINTDVLFRRVSLCPVRVVVVQNFLIASLEIFQQNNPEQEGQECEENSH